MPIDTSKDPDFRYKFLRRWTHQGHEVALVRVKSLKRKNEKWSETYLVCEHDFPDDRSKGHVHGSDDDPHACKAKAAVRLLVMREARVKHGAQWKALGMDKAVLDIHRRTKRGQWLGQVEPSMIYAQEVAKLLGVSFQEALEACGRLFAEEKLDLNGMILTDYVARFRLPREMNAVIFRVVGDPLGYPNDDAGDFAVWKFERGTQAELGYESGKAAFGSANFPHIDPLILADHVFDWLAAALEKAAADSGERDGLRWARRRDLMKPLAKLAVSHPEIRSDVMAEYLREMIRLSFGRVELDRAMRIDKDMMDPAALETRTLKEMAEEFRQWSDAFRRMAKERPR